MLPCYFTSRARKRPRRARKHCPFLFVFLLLFVCVCLIFLFFDVFQDTRYMYICDSVFFRFQVPKQARGLG